MTSLENNLRANKLKVTPQRLAIYTYLYKSKEHPTVETIYNDLKESFPAMSIATVYKTVASLRDAHLIREFNISEDSNRYDAHTDQHAHIICTKCHSITDYYGEIAIDSEIKKVEEISGFRIEKTEVNIYGLCEKCLNKK